MIERPGRSPVWHADGVDRDASRGDRAEIRVAELLLGLSAVADLGIGQPVGSAARTCAVAVTLARATGCDERTVSDVYFAALLQHIGCTAYSHEATLLFADEQSIKSASLVTDFERPREILFGYLPTIAREAPAGEKLRTVRGALLHGRSLTDGYSRANCEVASMVARRLGLPDGVQTGLLQVFERWDGKGRPGRLYGEDASAVARIVNVAAVGALFDRLGGADAAVRVVSQRAGRMLDPAMAASFEKISATTLAELAAADACDVLADLEPRPAVTTREADLDAVLRTFGEGSTSRRRSCTGTARMWPG